MSLLDSVVARDTFERELERVRRWYGCYIVGYVVMPEHVHLLMSEPERNTLSVVIQMLKQMTSRKLKPIRTPHFWQTRYYGFPVWSERKRVEKLRYIHRNPVKRGLVTKPGDWRWSSFLQWATGCVGTVEIECTSTALKRERTGTPLTIVRIPPCRKERDKGGATAGTVEIECPSTALKRERTGTPLTIVRIPPCRKERDKGGATVSEL